MFYQSGSATKGTCSTQPLQGTLDRMVPLPDTLTVLSCADNLIEELPEGFGEENKQLEIIDLASNK